MTMEKLNNHKLDFLVRNANKKFVEKTFNSKNFDPLKFVSHLLKPFV